MSPLVIGVLAFVGIATLVGGAAMLFSQPQSSRLEDRLDVLTGAVSPSGKDDLLKDNSVLSRPLDNAPTILAQFFAKFGNLDRFLEQADTSLSIGKLVAVAAALAVAATASAMTMKAPVLVQGAAAFCAAWLPLLWLLMRRKKRLKHFSMQLPDALEMLARILRSGQSMAFGFNAVATEMSEPIGKEFGRVFEEQNLGVPMDESLRSMCDRVPNLDLRFFVTAVILQRQTGGDLSEILDKIGELVRDRFRVLGAVQALTGEGRLSGVVLMALPLVLFVVVYRMNPEYVSMLFTDRAGKKMLAVAVFMQILGAFVIKKIVDIKV